MGTCKYTPFGLCVKTELLKRGLEQKWLEEEIRKKTNLYVDSSYMNKILTGKRNPEKIINCICEVLNLCPDFTLPQRMSRKTDFAKN